MMNPLIGGLLGSMAGNYLMNKDNENGTVWDKLGFSGANAQPSEQMPVSTTSTLGQQQIPEMMTQFQDPLDNQQLTQQSIMNMPLDARTALAQNPMPKGGVASQFENQIKQPPPPEEEPGFMSQMGDSISDFWNDEEKMARLTIGLNSMRLNPDANLAKSMQSRIDKIQKNKGSTKTAQALRAMGREDLAKMVESGQIDAKTAVSLAYEKKSALQEKMDLYNKDPELFAKMVEEGVIGGGGVTVNTGDKTNMEFTKAGIKDAQTQIESGYSADNSLRDIALLRKLGSNPILQEVPDMARGFVPQGYSPAIDAYNGQLDKVAKGLRQAGEGVMTEKDFEVLQQTSGAASMNLQARQILQSSLEETAKRQIERSNIASQFMSQQISLADYYSKMSQLKNKPMFTTDQIDYLNSLKGMMGYGALNDTEKQSVSQDKWNKMSMQQKEAFIKARSE